MMPFYPRGTFPATSNTQRQREFRERNPGYCGRLHRRQKAEVDAIIAAQKAAAQVAAQVQVEAVTPLALPAPVMTLEQFFPDYHLVRAKAKAEAVAVR